MKNPPISLFIICCVISQSCSETNSANIASSLSKKEDLLVGKFCLQQPPIIGTKGDVTVHEGGFSALYLVPGTENEFYAINDRGPNLEINHHPLANGKNIKYFPFPNYAQQLHHLAMQGDSLVIKASRTIFGTSGATFSGINGLENGKDEISWIDLNGTQADRPTFFMDAEAITLQGDSFIWVGEEYRPALLKFDAKTLQLLSVLDPIASADKKTKSLPSILTKREPNRGFEAIAFDGKETIYAMLQSPLLVPDSSVIRKTRLLRMLAWNTATEEAFFLVYEMGKKGYERAKADWKIGDMAQINASTFLVLEHGSTENEKLVDIYVIDITKASRFTYEPEFTGQRLEELINSTHALSKGVVTVKKTHLLNLVEHGYDIKQGKPEGLTIVNDSTIAVLNDNDYGVEASESGEYIKTTGINTCLYLYRVPKTHGKLHLAR